MKKIFNLIIGTLLCVSCGDFLQEYSQDLTYANSCADLDEILIGNGYMKQSENSNVFYYGENYGYYPYLHLMDDDSEECLTGRVNLGFPNPVYYMRGFYSWAKNPFTDYNGSIFTDADWKRMYQHVGYLNVIISYVKEFSDEPEEIRRRIKGEALFLRAGYYFMLVNLYAKPYVKGTAALDMGVPLNLTEYIEAKFFSRASVATVYQQITTDLKDAITNLAGIKQPTIYRADEIAARALLSRVYLYMGEWQLTIDECNKIMELGCKLRDLNDFNAGNGVPGGSEREYFNMSNSPEIFFTQGSSTVGMLLDNKYSTTRYRISDELCALYSKYEEQGIKDLRKTCFLEKSRTYGESSYYYMRKSPEMQYEGYEYVLPKPTVFDSFILRAAEVYLNKAEAEAMLDQPETANTMQAFMDKRYADHKYPSIAGLNGKNMVEFIREERRKELSFEGHRWFDLRRYAVSPKYPEKKSISHATYRSAVNYGEKAPLDRIYTLKPYGEDNAWVLPLPPEELVFNNGVLVDNPTRTERN
ncbi:RagB/SusD family nutrient uptake outer membrane protein [Gabonibacter chumensis]|uniref:RagB/SusD family nutrient uptake outer membrane protein n=1 Tax=Gabonibacter chumensis TaxID=2972474 RepID=UPI0025726209|nr:RagB/SusD family nutrient uptake outer membrane protein [Gabonibacter chumensis]MCR9011541.1 RagB/SusD family nutrient uptake outer membrane protein [Gabonibacter chumensis]